MGIATTLVATVILFQTINPVFLSPGNATVMLRALAYTGIISVGMALCLMGGVLDLSVGATAGLASVLAAEAMTKLGAPLWLGFVIAISTGVIVGFVNAILITRLNLNAFIATIATSFIVKGLANWVCSGYSVYPLPVGVQAFGSSKFLGVSLAFWALILALIVVAWILYFTVLGLEIRATGSDRESAVCNEVDVKRANTLSLMIVGGLAGLSGILLTILINSGSPTLGSGWELTIITACVLGGVSLNGYEGSMVGLFLGLLFLQVIQNGMIMIGISAYLNPVAVGCILVAAMAFDTRRRKYLNLEKL
jgi:ribose transport system permease protein